MKKRQVFASVFASAMALSAASGVPVNLGNLTVYNNPLTFVPFSAPAGGPYVKFSFTTNWSYGFGTAKSNAAAWYVGNPTSSLLASLTSVTGMANNGNPTTITVTGNFSVGLTNAMTQLQFIAAQNQYAAGQFNLQAFWSNTVLNLYVQKPLPPVPTGIENLGAVHITTQHRVTVDTGGSTFNPSVAVYSEDGYLLGTNGNNTGLPGGGTALTDMILSNGVYYVFVAGDGATFGEEDLDVEVPPGAPGGTLGGGVGGLPWPVTEIGEGEGQWYSFTVAPPACPGDVNGDGFTNVGDFNILASNFNRWVTPFTDGDLNGDGFVNVADFNILAGNFGCTSW